MFLPSNITLKFGDSGDFVAELQRRLAMVKCFGDDQVNGFYDGATVNGVMMFQGMNGLHADGVAGPETLRRLNGVIAGDTTSSGSEDKKEEETQQSVTDNLTLMHQADQHQQLQHAAWGAPAPHAETAPAPQPVGLDPQMFAPAGPAAAPVISEADRADMARQQMAQRPPAVELTELLLTAEAQQQLQAQEAQQRTLANTPPPVQQQPMVPPPVEMQAALVQPAPVTPAIAPEPVQQAAAPVAEPQGLVQRAGRFANAMVQKLADYFEAKLPPSVLNEVKAAGQVMAAAGMKEAPIPTGPEMGGPAQQIPARGPEQQPAQVR